MAQLTITPSQTVGPFLAIGLPWPDGPFVVPEGTPGSITISGQVTDGADQPLPDALIETWQADPDGRFDHPDDPRGPVQASTVQASTVQANTVQADTLEAGMASSRPPGFRGFGRCATDSDGRFRIVTVRPGPLPSPGGGTEAPHIDVSVFARGLLNRVVTRIYFQGEEAANDADPVLASIADPDRRATLIAVRRPGGQEGEFRFDIRLQGPQETVFFDV